MEVLMHTRNVAYRQITLLLLVLFYSTPELQGGPKSDTPGLILRNFRKSTPISMLQQEM